MLSNSDLPVIHARAGGTSLLLAVGDSGMPQVLHWGSDLGALNAEFAAHAPLTQSRMIIDNDPDVVLDGGIIPGAWTGWTGRPGIIGHRTDGSAWSPRLATTKVEVVSPTGQRRLLQGSFEELGPGALEFTLDDPKSQLGLVLILELSAAGTIRVAATLTNCGAQAYHLDELSCFFPLPLEVDEVLDMSGRWGRERAPQRRALTFGQHLREGRHGRTGFDSPTLMICGTHGFSFRSGHVYGTHVASSANHRTLAERLPEGHQVFGGGELLMSGEVTLGKGESYTSPWIHFTHGIGLDEAARRLHRWVRAQPNSPSTYRPVTLNVWEAVTFDHSLPRLIELANRAARIGIERFVLDDGWFLGRHNDRAGLGDWRVDPVTWPNGLHPLVDHVRSLDMEFGLWVEPEMVNPDSELARAHPEWMLSAGADLPVEWRHQQGINLANPEAWEFIRSSLDAILSEYEISYLKWDHNRDLYDAGSQIRSGRSTISAHTKAAYRLMDRLRADHPGLEIESCASGGGRIDLEMVTHAQRFWPSDCIDPHERQSIIRWTEQLIPPEFLGTHVASNRNQTTGRHHDFAFRAATALWGHMGVEWDITELDESELDELALWINYYKENRDLLLSGDLIRGTVGDDTMWLNGIVAPDHSRAIVELVQRSRGVLTQQGVIRFPELDPQRTYRVVPRIIGSGPSGLILPPWAMNENGIVSQGSLLSTVGLRAPVLNPDQALLVEITAVEEDKQ